MTIQPELAYPLILAGIGGTAAWVKSIENRVTSHEEVIKRIDQLVQLLLEDRLDRGNPQFTPSGSQAGRRA
jgi:hypothetical protein